MSTRVSVQWRERGIAAARGGDRAAARDSLEQALEIDPQDEESWLWLSAVQDDPRGAAGCRGGAGAITPGNERPRAGRAAWRAGLPASPLPPPAAPRPPAMAGSPPAAGSDAPAHPFADA